MTCERFVERLAEIRQQLEDIELYLLFRAAKIQHMSDTELQYLERARVAFDSIRDWQRSLGK